MKIKYLGTAAAEGIPAIFCECDTCKRAVALGGRNIRTRSQAIIDDTLLIDFPADTYMHYLKWGVPINKIKACIITHSHADHLYPLEIEMRKRGFSHLEDDSPLVFYSDESGYNALNSVVKDYNISKDDVRPVKIEPFKSFETRGYTVTPVRATHDPASDPVIYAIEKDSKSLLYANDTSEPCEESMDCLKSLGRPFNVISLDCTEANLENIGYIGHMNLNKCDRLRERFIRDRIADENTVFILNHFSHNGVDVLYDEFSKIAGKRGFITSFDGMELEF